MRSDRVIPRAAFFLLVSAGLILGLKMRYWLFLSWPVYLALVCSKRRWRWGSANTCRKTLRGRIYGYILFVLFGTYMIPRFVGAAYEIPSASMRNTLLPGDFVWCNKLSYGTIVDMKGAQELLWLFFRPSSFCHYNEALGYSRIFSFSQPRRNDILIFENPAHPDEILIKRCIGLPGEKIEVQNGRIYINDLPIVEQATGLEIRDTSNYASLVIPAKGMKIRLTTASLTLYQQVIENYEGSPLPSSLMAGELQKPVYYTFKQDYYFALGDNRPGSADSRVWGVIPENYLVGRAILVLFSGAGARDRPLRLFHPIR